MNAYFMICETEYSVPDHPISFDSIVPILPSRAFLVKVHL